MVTADRVQLETRDGGQLMLNPYAGQLPLPDFQCSNPQHCILIRLVHAREGSPVAHSNID